MLVGFILIANLSILSAELNIELNPNNANLEIVENNLFNITAKISCISSNCNNFSFGLKIPNLQITNYNFSTSSQPDCFGGTCLTKPEGNGPLYNVSGKINWGCGKCFSNPLFAGENMRSLIDISCISGMKNIAGINLCVETENGEKWDLIFNNWPVGGIGDFVYTRNIERGIIKTTESQPFYITSPQNLDNFNLNSGESKELTFELKATGQINQNYNLIFFASDKESNPITISIKQAAQIETTNKTISSKHKSERTTDYNTNPQIIESVENESQNANQIIQLVNQEQTKDKQTNYKLIFMLVTAFFIVLIIFLTILYSLRKNKI